MVSPSKWAKVPSPALHDKRLKTSDKMTYVALCEFADRSGNCWPAVPTIAAVASLSVRAVQMSLSRLELIGYIQRRGRSEGGRAKSNVYRIAVIPARPLPDVAETTNFEAEIQEIRSSVVVNVATEDLHTASANYPQNPAPISPPPAPDSPSPRNECGALSPHLFHHPPAPSADEQHIEQKTEKPVAYQSDGGGLVDMWTNSGLPEGQGQNLSSEGGNEWSPADAEIIKLINLTEAAGREWISLTGLPVGDSRTVMYWIATDNLDMGDIRRLIARLLSVDLPMTVRTLADVMAQRTAILSGVWDKRRKKGGGAAAADLEF